MAMMCRLLFEASCCHVDGCRRRDQPAQRTQAVCIRSLEPVKVVAWGMRTSRAIFGHPPHILSSSSSSFLIVILVVPSFPLYDRSFLFHWHVLSPRPQGDTDLKPGAIIARPRKCGSRSLPGRCQVGRVSSLNRQAFVKSLI